MQKLDRATLFELQLRDSILWPLVRPLGVLYEYLGHPFIEAVSHTLLIGTKPFGLPRFIRKSLKPKFLKREIFTLANLVSLYGLFLFGQLLYLMWGLLWGRIDASIYSLTAYFWDLRAPDLWAISWTVFEIFISDMVDGPLARKNKAVTALGTMLDHTRDYLTGFAALFFLIAVSIISADWPAVALEIAILMGFAAIVRYHQKFMLRARNRTDRAPTAGQISPGGYSNVLKNIGIAERIGQEFKFLRAYALEQYQTRLIGRVQFAALAVAIGLGLFSYATAIAALRVLFLAGLGVSAISTLYYTYDLGREYREKSR